MKMRSFTEERIWVTWPTRVSKGDVREYTEIITVNPLEVSSWKQYNGEERVIVTMRNGDVIPLRSVTLAEFTEWMSEAINEGMREK